jgi:hypothetical protein
MIAVGVPANHGDPREGASEKHYFINIIFFT